MINTNLSSQTMKFMALMGAAIAVALFSSAALAGGGGGAAEGTIGAVAASVTETFGAIAQLITATSYIAGLGFAIGAVLKFKQHKDNPTQIPIGTPVALLFVAAALLFLPSIMETAGATLFGDGANISGVGGVTDVGEAYSGS